MNEEFRVRDIEGWQQLAAAIRQEYSRQYPKFAEVKLKTMVEGQPTSLDPYYDFIVTRILTIWNQMVYSVSFRVHERATPFQYAMSFKQAMDELIQKLYHANCYIVPALGVKGKVDVEELAPKEEERRKFEL